MGVKVNEITNERMRAALTATANPLRCQPFATVQAKEFMQRDNYQASSQTIQVLVDGQVVGTITRTGTSYVT